MYRVDWLCQQDEGFVELLPARIYEGSHSYARIGDITVSVSLSNVEHRLSLDEIEDGSDPVNIGPTCPRFLDSGGLQP